MDVVGGVVGVASECSHDVLHLKLVYILTRLFLTLVFLMK